jgi:hypothetical protein
MPVTKADACRHLKLIESDDDSIWVIRQVWHDGDPDSITIHKHLEIAFEEFWEEVTEGEDDASICTDRLEMGAEYIHRTCQHMGPDYMIFHASFGETI